MRQLTQAIQDKFFADRVLHMADIRGYVEDVWHSTLPSISESPDFMSDAVWSSFVRTAVAPAVALYQSLSESTELYVSRYNKDQVAKHMHRSICVLGDTPSPTDISSDMLQ